MKKKVIIITAFILGAIMFTGIGVFATMKISANQIDYKGTPVDEVIDDLYSLKSFGEPDYDTIVTINKSSQKTISMEKTPKYIVYSYSTITTNYGFIMELGVWDNINKVGLTKFRNSNGANTEKRTVSTSLPSGSIISITENEIILQNTSTSAQRIFYVMVYY